MQAEQFNDTSNTDEWQKEVYEFAAAFMRQQNYKEVIDVGCGSAFKLMHYLDQYITTGVEVGATYEWLIKKYPSRKWTSFDSTAKNLKTDLVICSDVIEHLPNPDTLVRFIRSIQSSHIILSTPERDAVAGTSDYGPPENTAHYREWNLPEFSLYLSQWFKVLQHKIIVGKSISQVIVCSLK